MDYYEEDGFRVDSLPYGASGTYIGNYHGGTNDVIHSHWEEGGLGSVTMIKVTKIDGTALDLNYFNLTTNTFQGGGPANGTEQAYIHASTDRVTSSFSQLLPPEDWGLGTTSQIFLGSEFDNIKAFWFVVQSDVDCYGMDEFYVDEPAPPNPNAVPVPASAVLLVLGGLSAMGYTGLRRRKLAVAA